MERCWHGKFGGTNECRGEGRYGNPDDRCHPDPLGVDGTIQLTRTARWCADHKRAGDLLLGPHGGVAPSEQSAASADGEGAR
jgi:hypothetical protein